MVDVRIKPSALREFSALDPDVQRAFDVAFHVLQESPNPLRPSEPLDLKQLRRAKLHWRLKVGRHRAVFRWDGAVLEVVMVDHRRRVYDRLSELGV